MLAAGLCFFNDAPSLERCLPTLDWFDLVIAIDGRFKGFDWPEKLSTDGSREVINRFPNTVLIDAPDLLEYQKRQVYFDLSAKYEVDQLLIIDADEYLQSNWHYFKQWIDDGMDIQEKHLAYKVPVADHINTKWFRFMTRLFTRPKDMEYRKLHWAIALKTDPIGKYIDSKRCGYSVGIHLEHDHLLRNQDYIKRREKFQITQREYEINVNTLNLEHKDEAIAKIKRELGQI